MAGTGPDPITGWSRPCARLSCRTALIDGEIVVQDENGVSDFDALRSVVHKAPHRIVFFAFDAAMSSKKPALKGLRKGQWGAMAKAGDQVRVQHLNANGTLRHAKVKALIEPCFCKR